MFRPDLANGNLNFPVVYDLASLPSLQALRFGWTLSPLHRTAELD